MATLSWLDSFFGPAVVRFLSTLYPKRPVLEFIAAAGATVSVADSPTNGSTQVTIGAGSFAAPGSSGQLTYNAAGTLEGTTGITYLGSGRLNVDASSYISFESGGAPAVGFIRAPYSAGYKSWLSRKSSAAVDCDVLACTGDVASLGAPTLTIAVPNNLSLGSATPASFGGGSGVVFRAHATVAPTTNPTAGVLDYVDATRSLPRTRLTTGRIVTQDGCSPAQQGLRLTLSPGSPVPLLDVTAGTTLYLSPYTSGSIALYDGASWVRFDTAEVSLALAGLTASTNYDVFAYSSGANVVLELTAWTNNVARATALVRQDGVLVRSGSVTRRYVGTIRATGATTCEDTVTQRFVYNADNQIERHLLITDATASWTYASTTVRQVRATGTNRVELVLGSVGNVNALALGQFRGSASGLAYLPGVGLDTTTVNSALPIYNGSTAAFATEVLMASAAYDGALIAGYHAVNWLESIASAASVTIYGTSTGAGSSMRVRAEM